VRARVVALHGFLGRASDWDLLRQAMPQADICALDLWQVLGDARVVDWATATAAVDRALADALNAAPDAAPAFIVGYSMGARLVLGSARLGAGDPTVRGCCFVSCSPGLAEDDSAGRVARRASDAAWARRILVDPEDALWEAWNAQPVFAGSAPVAVCGPLPATRRVLARVLDACSVAGQPDLRPRFREWPTRVLWVTGARDSRFSAMAAGLAEAGAPAEFVTCDNAGHRVPWDNPPAFAAVLQDWIDR
jgi:2-succinyl-6-hydroxy-2,4-cyclohexadiene-1-carboxylate synthase